MIRNTKFSDARKLFAEALQLLADRGIPLPEMDTSYFLSRDIVMPSLGKGMSAVRRR